MKKLFIFLAMALTFAACQQDGAFNAKNSDLVDVILNIDAPELGITRTDGDQLSGRNSALGAIDFMTDADWANYDIRYILEVYDANDDGTGEPIYLERLVNCLDKYAPTTFSLRLVPDRDYKFVVFADYVAEGNAEKVEPADKLAIADLYYNTADLRNISTITSNPSWNAMNEVRDAYFVSENVHITTTLQKTLTLTRPFAKLRVIATDLDYITGYATPGYVEVTYKNHYIYKSFNAVSGNLNTEVLAGNELTHAYEVSKYIPYTDGYDASSTNQTLFADYLLAVEGQQTSVNFEMSVYESKGGRLIKTTDFSTEIPVQRNYLTTIIGDLLTTQANITIEVNDNFTDEWIIGAGDGNTNELNGWGPGVVASNGNYEFEVNANSNIFLVSVNSAAVGNNSLAVGHYVLGSDATASNNLTFTVSNLKANNTRAMVDVAVVGGFMDVEKLDNTYGITLDLAVQYSEYDIRHVVYKYVGVIEFGAKLDAPEVSATVNDNNVALSWGAVEGATKYFVSVNGGVATEITDLAVTYTNLEWESSYTFTVYAANDSIESEATSVTVQIGAEPVIETYNIYLKNEDNWEAVYFYAWGDEFKTEDWPGDKMSKTTVDEVEYFVYNLPVTANDKAINFLFNNGGNGKQTADYTDVVINKDYYYTNYVEPAQPSDFVVYLKPNSNWKVDNARFAAYFFGNGDTWVDATLVEGETDIYAVTVPAGYPNIIFCRMSPTAAANNWNNKWNQTADLEVPTDGTNLYTVKEGTWDNGGGTWSTYTPAVQDPVALATPEVKAEVNVNIVTLTWEAVEGAAHYTVQVDDDVEEVVNDTTYVFEGDYEFEYTFTVKAIAADTTKNLDSEAAVVAATTEAKPVVEPTYTTVADFLAAEVNAEVYYYLKGTITSVVNTSYGNFDLTDDTGTVYVYGLNSEDGSTNKYWATSGAKLGDDIVIYVTRGEYNGNAQGANARFVELLPGTRAFYTVDTAAVDFTSAGGEQDIEISAYNTTAGVTATSDNSAFTVNVNGYVVTVTAAANELEEDVEGNITIKVGDLEATIVKATIAAKPASGAVEGGSDDFHTISNTNTSYVSGKTTAGWAYTNCAIFKGGSSDSSPAFKMIGDASNRALCMNGKTSAVGTITSPTLNTGCGTLKFNYGLPFSDTKIKFRVDIMQNGEVVKTFTINPTSVSKLTKYSHEETIDVAGDFQIVFTNLSPSNSTSNKDRTAIWDVEWTGYNN